MTLSDERLLELSRLGSEETQGWRGDPLLLRQIVKDMADEKAPVVEAGPPQAANPAAPETEERVEVAMQAVEQGAPESAGPAEPPAPKRTREEVLEMARAVRKANIEARRGDGD